MTVEVLRIIWLACALHIPTSSGTNHVCLESFCRPAQQQSTAPASRHQHRQSDSQLVTESLPSAHCQYDHPVTHDHTANSTWYCSTSHMKQSHVTINSLRNFLILVNQQCYLTIFSSNICYLQSPVTY